MTDIKPLYINGKRDKARRYVLSTGEIISRRQYIKITEGVSPESKAYARYLAGKAPKGRTDYLPLYVGGKRDKAGRYVNPSTGKIISRRQYIKITEGVSPESKAYARYLAGKAPKGVTARKYEQRLKRKAEKERKEEIKKDRKVWGSEYHRIPKKRMPTGGERGYYQLQGTYRFYNMKYRYYAESVGYSTATDKLYPYGSPNYLILRRQAIENAVAKLDGYDWKYVGVIEEAWLLW